MIRALGNLVLFSVLCGYGASGLAASFDCDRSATAMERGICATPIINRLDGEMGDLYEQLLNALPEAAREQLRNGQRTWIEVRNSQCGPAAAGPTEIFVNCVEPLYQRRIHHLRLELGQPHLPHYPSQPEQRVCGSCQSSGPDAGMGCAGYTSRSGCVSSEQCAWVVSRCPD